jgi:hypothetical protein
MPTAAAVQSLSTSISVAYVARTIGGEAAIGSPVQRELGNNSFPVSDWNRQSRLFRGEASRFSLLQPFFRYKSAWMVTDVFRWCPGTLFTQRFR